MEYQVVIQGTPNPNALKFILNVPVKTSGNVTYKTAGECQGVPLAEGIFSFANIAEVFFFDNYITVTQDGAADWEVLERQIKEMILERVAGHHPDFVSTPPVQPVHSALGNQELNTIDAILDRTVRPALQMDGGDLRLINLENNVLKIAYQGACGSCPSATMGTLRAIENLLRQEYNSAIVVELAY